MAIDINSYTDLLKRRIKTLDISKEKIEEAEKIALNNGYKDQNIGNILKIEWLNDILKSKKKNVYLIAAKNPEEHFINWIKERTKNKYHVTYRSFDLIEKEFGTNIAIKMLHEIWPQEIAWAQRLRTDNNPVTSTKCAMFLREVESNAGKIFEKIALIYTEKFSDINYYKNPAHNLSPEQIRFNNEIPNFTPLFLYYASTEYSAKLKKMTKEKLELYSKIAEKDEINEKKYILNTKSINYIKEHPIRQFPTIINAAISMNITSNQLFNIENEYILNLEKGNEILDNSSSIPIASFLLYLTNNKDNQEIKNKNIKNNIEKDDIIWTIINLDRYWVKKLPSYFKKYNLQLEEKFNNWKEDISKEKREPPYDIISDFCFFLMKE